MGLKGEYFEGALNTSIAVFQTDQENIAILVPDQSLCPGNLGCYQAAGLVRSRGIDLEMQGAITPNWQLSAGYTYVDSEIKKDSNPSMVGIRSNPFLPQHQITLSTLYHISDKWRAGANLRWQSKIYRESGSSFRSEQDAYVIAGIMAGFRVNQNFDLQFNLENIFDKTYYQGISSSPRSPAHIYAPPRNFMITARYSFR